MAKGGKGREEVERRVENPRDGSLSGHFQGQYHKRACLRAPPGALMLLVN